jgi:tRNA-dihydrouridine synthase 3
LTALQYPKPITDAYLKELEAAKEDSNGPEEDVAVGENNVATDDPLPISSELVAKRTGHSDPNAQTDTPDVLIRVQEKRRLNWSGKSCMVLSSLMGCNKLTGHLWSDLAPLTTVGNLVRMSLLKQ